MKIKVEKIQKINEGILYEWYRATNMQTGEKRDQKNSYEYKGSDIVNHCILTDEQLSQLPMIFGKKYSEEIIVFSEIREYSVENCLSELEKEGWSEEIENTIAYVFDEE